MQLENAATPLKRKQQRRKNKKKQKNQMIDNGEKIPDFNNNF